MVPAPGTRTDWSSLPPPPSAPAPLPPGSGARLGRSAAKAAEVSRAVSAVGAVGALAVVVATLVFGQPVPLVEFGLILVVPAIAFGQLRTIVSGLGHQRQRVERAALDGPERRRTRRAAGSSFDDLFGGLTPRQRRLVIGLIALGWIVALPGIALAPTPPATSSSCEATLTEHGDTRCVDRGDLVRYQAGLQRFAAGLVFGFCVVHAAAAHSDLRRRDESLG